MAPDNTGQAAAFQLTPSRRATEETHVTEGRKNISTHALTEGDHIDVYCIVWYNISTHALTEGDGIVRVSLCKVYIFQLTPSRRATRPAKDLLRTSQFQLTPSRRATFVRLVQSFCFGISTHALTEGDIRMIRSCDFPVISTHALTEGDGIPERNSKPALEFQLTPSRRATFSAIVSLSFSAYFNSRPHGGRRQCVYICAVTVYFNSRPHGGRPRTGVISGDSTAISTHALTEGDLSPFTYCPLSMLFQLTPSRRATFAPFFLSFKNKDFNSRPHGGRRYLRAATVS